MTDWARWRMCSVCKAPTGDACYSLSGRIVTDERGMSVPDHVRTVLDQPHRARSLRTERVIPDGFTEGLGLHS